MFESKTDLVVFLKVFESLSFSTAAEALRMTPGMVSKRLSALEQDLGARLFHRTTRQVAPTEEGRRFYQQARTLCETMESFEKEWRHQGEPSGLLRVTASASFARLYLLPLVTRFLDENPKVRIDLDLTDRVLDIVAEGIDLAIRFDHPADSSLIAKKLAPTSRVLCAAPKYLKRAGTPKHPRDLAEHNCLTLHGQQEWAFEKNGKRVRQKVSGNFSTNYGEALLQAVRAGLGVAMLASWHFAHERALVPLLPGYSLSEPRSIYALYPSRRQLPLKTAAFLAFLEKHLVVPG